MLISLLAGLYLFVLRLVDTTFFTLRLMMTLRGRRLLAWITAFAGSVVYVIAVRDVLSGQSDWVKLIGYSAGFATGMLVGMWFEERIAVGYTRFQVISPRLGAHLVECLREGGYAVTQMPARGKDSAVDVLQCIVPRRQAAEVERVILATDPDAFVVAQDLRPLQRGYWPS